MELFKDKMKPQKKFAERRQLVYATLAGFVVAYCFFAAVSSSSQGHQQLWPQHNAQEAQCRNAAVAAASAAPDWPANLPSWFNRSNPEQLFGKTRTSRCEEGGIHGSQWSEDVYAFTNFFSGQVAGSYLEIGGLDGVRYSNTLWYHQHLAWRGMLVEGSPKSYGALKRNRPHDITVNAAICTNKTRVHYAQHAIGAVEGIIEFMSEGLKNHWYQQLDAAAKIEVACVPLRDILAHYNIRHVDFFSLDVEGAELIVLQSIDFNCFSFNVMTVELDGTNPDKDARVRSLLTEAGYNQHSHVHNNTWFVRQGFQPFAAAVPAS